MQTLARPIRRLQPERTRLPPARMIVVRTVGDPRLVRSRVLDALFAAAGAADQIRPPAGAPRVRWRRGQLGPPERWEARWAIPVTAGGAGLTAPHGDVPMQEELWLYGLVAQVAHPGPAATRPLAVRVLDEYVYRAGLRASGWYEEEFAGDPWDPDDLTIVRYPLAN